MKRWSLPIVALVLASSACESEEQLRREIAELEKKNDSSSAALDSAYPFGHVDAVLGGTAVSVNFDLTCQHGQTVASLISIPRGASPWPDYLVVDARQQTTLVTTQVDTFPSVDEQWRIGPAHIAATMPVTLGRRLEGADTLRVILRAARGDTAVVSLPVGKAGPRLRQVARECRWPA